MTVQELLDGLGDAQFLQDKVTLVDSCTGENYEIDHVVVGDEGVEIGVSLLIE